jgi:hypothetical protein
MVRLPWAQEAPGSNPGAPTKNISRVFFSLLKVPFTQPPSVEFWQTGGPIAQVVWFHKIHRMTSTQKHGEAGVPFRNHRSDAT